MRNRKKYSVAIVGATGLVGQMICNILAERSFPLESLYFIGSAKSAGKIIKYTDSSAQNRESVIHSLDNFDFSKVDFVLSSAGNAASQKLGTLIQKTSAVLVDNSQFFRMREDVPLVIPEINSEDLQPILEGKQQIIANPNCSITQVAIALHPLKQHLGIKRVITSTYQSVSGAGKAAMTALHREISATNYQDNDNYDAQQSIVIPQISAKYPTGHSKRCSTSPFNKQIAFNAIPQIDVFLESGITKEEWKMEKEICKIMGEDVAMHANCARIPSINSHAAYMNIELSKPFSIQDIHAIYNDMPHIVLNTFDDINGTEDYTTNIDASGRDEVFISRIRMDKTTQNAISMWCVTDNLRKGAALNTVQIAETIIRMMEEQS